MTGIKTVYSCCVPLLRMYASVMQVGSEKCSSQTFGLSKVWGEQEGQLEAGAVFLFQIFGKNEVAGNGL